MKKWTRWQDWVAVVAGLYAALATLWTTPAGASLILMLVFGILLVAFGVWNLAQPGMVVTEWVQLALGVLLFISPWIGVYAAQTGVAWTSWIAGAVALIVSALAIQPSSRAHHEAIAH